MMLGVLGLLFLAGCNGPTESDARSIVAADANATAQTSDTAVVQMRAAIEVGDWKRADQFAQAALIVGSTVAQTSDSQLFVDVAQVYAMNGRKRDAAKLLAEAVSFSNFQPASRIDFTVQALIDVGELYQAIELLERFLQVHPENAAQRRRLIGFLGEAHRLEKIPPHLQQLIEQRQFDFPLLVAMTETSFRRFLTNSADELMKRNPSDHRVRLGQAFDQWVKNEPQAAGKIVDEILDHHPDFGPAYAYRGQALVGQSRFDDLDTWLRDAPATARDYSEYWLTIGDWANERDNFPAAARAYWEASRCDVNSSTAWACLGQAIRSAQQVGPPLYSDQMDAQRPFGEIVTPEQLASIDQRLADLLELRRVFYVFSAGDRKRQQDAVDVAAILLKLGRTWEAEAWSAGAIALKESLSNELEPLRNRILEKLKMDQSWQSQTDRLELTMNLQALPSFSGEQGLAKAANSVKVTVESSSEHLRLAEESDAWGIAGVGNKNSPDDARLAPLIRSTGVGGGTIDYDLDGWSDVLLMAAGGTMLKSDSMPNELYRNLGDRLINVREDSGVGDRGFGQGVAVGDFNEDGFPDLFYANLGANRLLANNGDGTFRDRTDWLGDRRNEWTTSAAFVDLNADGLSDLMTVNYCETVAHLDQACANEDGVLGPCHPLRFAAQGDRVYAARPDGRMDDMTQAWISDVSPCRGLGIVAGALDGKQLAVFVANDIAANQFYTFGGSGPLNESAMARGIAVDARTMTQASMGVATGDYDGDGDLDFFVTGFTGEYNIFYEQVAAGFWRDASRRLDLVDPFLPFVGFGTQTIDLDNDGVDEILITNGHIGDFPEPDSPPYEQPFQIIRRTRDGGFGLVDDDAWGSYFSKPHVGRTLWTIDLNRDRKLDALVTHLHEPIAVLINHCEDANHSIGFRLVATRSSRDAVGAVIRFDADRPRTLWALSGDGYFCSNEKILRAGLADQDHVENITVTWPDGSVDELGSLQADCEYLIVQGQPEAFESHQ